MFLVLVYNHFLKKLNTTDDLPFCLLYLCILISLHIVFCVCPFQRAGQLHIVDISVPFYLFGSRLDSIGVLFVGSHNWLHCSSKLMQCIFFPSADYEDFYVNFLAF